MKTIKRSDCKVIRDCMNIALKTLAEELGLTIEVGNASYDDTSVTFKVKCVCEGVDKDKEEFERVCGKYDLKASAHGFVFYQRGAMMKLVGINTRASKFPFKVENPVTGKRYKFPRGGVLMAKLIEAGHAHTPEIVAAPFTAKH